MAWSPCISTLWNCFFRSGNHRLGVGPVAGYAGNRMGDGISRHGSRLCGGAIDAKVNAGGYVKVSVRVIFPFAGLIE